MMGPFPRHFLELQRETDGLNGRRFRFSPSRFAGGLPGAFPQKVAA
jgi:hypothetical protein